MNQNETCLPTGSVGLETVLTYSRTSGPPNCFTRIPRTAAIVRDQFYTNELQKKLQLVNQSITYSLEWKRVITCTHTTKTSSTTAKNEH